MTLYLVHGNTYFERYGYEESLFGAYTTLAQAEAAKIVAENKLKEMIEENYGIYATYSNDVELQILELKADELVDIYLGGYIE